MKVDDAVNDGLVMRILLIVQNQRALYALLCLVL